MGPGRDSKVLVANRGEIAIRAFRAAYELGVRHRRRLSPTRTATRCIARKPTSPTRSASVGHPVRAYLDVESNRRRRARRAGADAVYPGYGFLSENPHPRRGLRGGGHHLRRPARRGARLTGNKVARDSRRRREAGLPTCSSAPPHPSTRSAALGGGRHALPAVCEGDRGGGGRGMRRVRTWPSSPEAIEAGHAGGRLGVRGPDGLPRAGGASTRATSRCRCWPTARLRRSISSSGTARCSAATRRSSRWRPRQNLDPRNLRGQHLRRRGALRPTTIGYVNAGTVEFLLDERGRHVFIEMNPRIQVEHTVTEEITDVDLVPGQFLIASGSTPRGSGHRARGHPSPSRRGAAVPDHHRGPRQRASGRTPDASRGYRCRRRGGHPARRRHHPWAPRSARYFDSMLVKLTCRGRDLARRGDPGAPRDDRVPHPRRLDEYPVPAGGSGRPGLRAGRVDQRRSSTSARSC